MKQIFSVAKYVNSVSLEIFANIIFKGFSVSMARWMNVYMRCSAMGLSVFNRSYSRMILWRFMAFL